MESLEKTARQANRRCARCGYKTLGTWVRDDPRALSMYAQQHSGPTICSLCQRSSSRRSNARCWRHTTSCPYDRSWRFTPTQMCERKKQGVSKCWTQTDRNDGRCTLQTTRWVSQKKKKRIVRSYNQPKTLHDGVLLHNHARQSTHG